MAPAEAYLKLGIEQHALGIYTVVQSGRGLAARTCSPSQSVTGQALAKVYQDELRAVVLNNDQEQHAGKYAECSKMFLLRFY